MNEGLEIVAAIENLENQEQANFERQRHFYQDCFEVLSDIKFIKMFRLTKNLTRHLIRNLEEYINPRNQAGKLTIQEMVVIALRFYASGSYQTCIGESRFLAVSQASVSRCIQIITDALNRPEILQRYVHFPNNIEQLNFQRRKWFEKYRIPGIIGSIDCTHVAIFPPKKNDADQPEHIFVNRKGYHSINVQLVCDTTMRIMHVNARFPGSTHDNYIFQNSNLHAFVQNLYETGNEGYFLIGDSGYPLRPWIMTPLLNANNERENEFNRRLKSARSTIERCNGLLKARFRCLLKHRVLHYSPQKASQIINACTVLHNICIEHNVELLLDDDENMGEDLGMIEVEPVAVVEEQNRNRNPLLVRGEQIRQTIINSLRE